MKDEYIKDKYLLPYFYEKDTKYYVRHSLFSKERKYVLAFVWNVWTEKGIDHMRWNWYLTMNGAATKETWDTPEGAMADADKKLVELGYVLLTEEQAERLKVLI
jgi:hypothetical protein